jgi:hypothetical protein
MCAEVGSVMTNELLSEYIDRSVELQFATGQRLTGELLAGGDVQIVLGQPFAIKQPAASPTEVPTFRSIADASLIAWVRVLEQTREMLD